MRFESLQIAKVEEFRRDAASVMGSAMVVQPHALPRGGSAGHANFMHEYSIYRGAKDGKATSSSFRFCDPAATGGKNRVRSQELKYNAIFDNTATELIRFIQLTRGERVTKLLSEFCVDDHGDVWLVNVPECWCVKKARVLAYTGKGNLSMEAEQRATKAEASGQWIGFSNKRRGLTKPIDSGPKNVISRKGLVKGQADRERHRRDREELGLSSTLGLSFSQAALAAGGGGDASRVTFDGGASVDSYAMSTLTQEVEEGRGTGVGRRGDGRTDADPAQLLGSSQQTGCSGDFCRVDIGVSGAESDALEMARSILSEEEYQQLQAARQRQDEGLDGAVAMPYQLSYRVLAQARMEKDLVGLLLRHLKKGTESDYVSQEYVDTKGLPETFPASYYRPVHVCANCFRVYMKVEDARAIALRKIKAKKAAKARKLRQQRTKLSNTTATSAAAAGDASESMLMDPAATRKSLADVDPEVLAAAQQLTLSELAELRSMSSPPAAVVLVTSALLLMLQGKVMSWPETRKALAGGDSLLRTMMEATPQSIPPRRIEALVPFITNPVFRPAALAQVSSAAAHLAEWITVFHRQAIQYHEIDVPTVPQEDSTVALEQSDMSAARSLPRISSASRPSTADSGRGEEKRSEFGASSSLSHSRSASRALQQRNKGSPQRSTGDLHSSKTLATKYSESQKARSSKLRGNHSPIRRQSLKDNSASRSVLRGANASRRGEEPYSTGPAGMGAWKDRGIGADASVDTIAGVRGSLKGSRRAPPQVPQSVVDSKAKKREAYLARKHVQQSSAKRLAAAGVDTDGNAVDDGRNPVPGLFEMDDETSFPYMVLGRPDPRHKANNFIVFHDLFDTYESTQILLRPFIGRSRSQVLLMNYPGQAYTSYPGQSDRRTEELDGSIGKQPERSTVLNNEFLAKCIWKLLEHLTQTREFPTAVQPFHIVAFGNGGNVAVKFAAMFEVQLKERLRSIVLCNSFARVDSQLSAILHSSVNVFSCFPPDRPDLPVSYFTRFLFSDQYIRRVTPEMALSLYTAVTNPISLDGRIQLCKGVLANRDLRDTIKALQFPIVVVQCMDDVFVSPANADMLIEGRTVRHIWAHQQTAIPSTDKNVTTLTADAADAAAKAEVLLDLRSVGHLGEILQRPDGALMVWLQAGHEIRQEAKKQISQLFYLLSEPEGAQIEAQAGRLVGHDGVVGPSAAAMLRRQADGKGTWEARGLMQDGQIMSPLTLPTKAEDGSLPRIQPGQATTSLAEMRRRERAMLAPGQNTSKRKGRGRARLGAQHEERMARQQELQGSMKSLSGGGGLAPVAPVSSYLDDSSHASTSFSRVPDETEEARRARLAATDREYEEAMRRHKLLKKSDQGLSVGGLDHVEPSGTAVTDVPEATAGQTESSADSAAQGDVMTQARDKEASDAADMERLAAIESMVATPQESEASEMEKRWKELRQQQEERRRRWEEEDKERLRALREGEDSRRQQRQAEREKLQAQVAESEAQAIRRRLQLLNATQQIGDDAYAVSTNAPEPYSTAASIELTDNPDATMESQPQQPSSAAEFGGMSSIHQDRTVPAGSSGEPENAGSESHASSVGGSATPAETAKPSGMFSSTGEVIVADRVDPPPIKPKPSTDLGEMFAQMEAADKEQRRLERQQQADYNRVKRELQTQKQELAAQEFQSRMENDSKAEIMAKHRAAVTIQSIARMFVAKCRVYYAMEAKKKDAIRNFAAQRIQSVARGVRGRKLANEVRRTRELEIALGASATDVQRTWRGYKGRQRAQWRREQKALDVLRRIIQGYSGRLKARRVRAQLAQLAMQNLAASRIQGTWKMFATREAFRELQIMQLAAIQVQRCFRGWLGRQKAARRRAWQRAEPGPERLALGLKLIEGTKESFERQRQEIDALHRAQERAEQQVSRIDAGLQESEKELTSIERQLQEINQLDQDLKDMTHDRFAVEQALEAKSERVSTAGSRPGTSRNAQQLEIERRRREEAYELETAIQLKQAERERKRQELEAEFAAVLDEVRDKKAQLHGLQDSIAEMEAKRQRKDREFTRLQRNLTELLAEQKRELDALREKGVQLEVATATSAAAAAATAQAAKENQKKSQALFQNTEELLKFQFMSMSMSYFSSLNMLSSLRDVNADTTNAAISSSADTAAAAAAAAAAANIPSMKHMKLGGGDLLDAASKQRKIDAIEKKKQLEAAQDAMARPFPEDIRKWSADDVKRWLDTLMLGQYKQAFEEAAVDGDFLMELQPADLRDVLGVEHQLHVKKIITSRDKLNPLNRREQQQLEDVLKEQAAAAARGEDDLELAGGERVVVQKGVPERETVFSQIRHNRVKRLLDSLEKGFPIETEDEHGNTPLVLAAQNVRTTCCRRRGCVLTVPAHCTAKVPIRAVRRLE